MAVAYWKIGGEDGLGLVDMALAGTEGNVGVLLKLVVTV